MALAIEFPRPVILGALEPAIVSDLRTGGETGEAIAAAAVEIVHEARTLLGHLGAEAIGLLQRDRPIRIVFRRDQLAMLGGDPFAGEVIDVGVIARIGAAMRREVVGEAGIIMRGLLNEIAASRRRRRQRPSDD